MSEPIELPENARELIDKALEADEDYLYTLLGETLEITEPEVIIPPGYRHYDSVASEGLNIISDHRLYRQEPIGRDVHLDWRTPLTSRLEAGKKFFEESREILHQKICIDMNACKWEKDKLEDTKTLFTLLLPAIGTTLGLTIPAAVATVTIIVMKWGIRAFCQCGKDEDN